MSKAGLYPLGTSDGNETYLGVTAAGAAGVLKRYPPGASNLFETKADAQAATIPASADIIVLGGHTTPGDAGQLLICKRRADIPSHLSASQGYVQTANGAIFEYVMPPEGFNIEWFGGQGDHNFGAGPAPTDTDNWLAWEKARQFFPLDSVPTAMYSTGPKVRFRKEKAYWFSQSIQVWGSCVLEGDFSGQPSYPSSTLVFPAGVHCIILHWYQTKQEYTFVGGKVATSTPVFLADTFHKLASGTIIRGLNIFSYGTTTNDPSIPEEHGIYCHVRPLIENCIISGTRWHGVNLWCSNSGGPDTYGNCNGFLLRDLRIIDVGRSAIHVQGQDANAGRAEGIDIVRCGGWGICDASFLGANKWDTIQVDEVGLRTLAMYGNWRLYELTSKAAVPPGGATGDDSHGPYVTSNSSTYGDVWQGADGYQWTRRDKGVWVSGMTPAVGDTFFVDHYKAFHRCDARPTPLVPATEPHQIGNPNTPDGFQYTTADGYTWTYLWNCEHWRPSRTFTVGQLVYWGAHIWYCADVDRANAENIPPGTNLDGTWTDYPVYPNYPAFISNSVWVESLAIISNSYIPLLWSPASEYIEGGAFSGAVVPGGANLGTQQSTFINCYIEGGAGSFNDIRYPCVIIGGLGMGTGYKARFGPAGGITANRMFPMRVVPAADTADNIQLAFSRVANEVMTILKGPTEYNAYEPLSWFPTAGYRAFVRKMGSKWIEYITTFESTSFTCGRPTTPIPDGEVVFPNGIYLCNAVTASTNPGPHSRRIDVGAAPPSGSEEVGAGDIRWNNSASGVWGWRAMSGGVASAVTFEALDPAALTTSIAALRERVEELETRLAKKG